MNCKPNEDCYIKKPGPHYGKVIKVLCLDGFDGPPHWEYEGTIIDPRGNRYTSIRDSILRPIRDPGDDASDETLSWKPVPLPTIEPHLLEVGK